MATATQPQAVKLTPSVSGKSLSILRRSLTKDKDSSSSSEDESGVNAKGEGIPTYSNVFDEMAVMEDNIDSLKASELKEWNNSNESDKGGSGTEIESETCPRTPGGAPTDAEEEDDVGPSECSRTADAAEEDVIDGVSQDAGQYCERQRN